MEADKESCLLSSLAEHIKCFQAQTSLDPAVMVKVNGHWCPVRAGIAATGEHRNAVAIEYLPPPAQEILRATYVVQEFRGGDWHHRSSSFDTLDEARQWMAEHTLRLPQRIVEVADRVVG